MPRRPRPVGPGLAFALALLLLAASIAGCTTPPAPPPPPVTPVPPPPPAGLDEAGILRAARAFDGVGAMDFVMLQMEAECRFDGRAACPEATYRIPGTEGSRKAGLLLADALAAEGWRVTWDNFSATLRGQPLDARNIVGERPGATDRTLYLAAHYDTRPWADKDPLPANRSLPVPGANDGASGVAVLLELARLLGERPLNLTLRILLLDAEDMGDGGNATTPSTSWIQGSMHHATTLTEADLARAEGLVLLDLVGDPGLELRREGYSLQAPHRALQDDLWAWAARLGHAQFKDESSVPITDDHVPYQKRGMRAVDIIHLDGGHGDLDIFPPTHHRRSDDTAHLSPASLEAVGETLFAALLAWDGEVRTAAPG